MTTLQKSDMTPVKVPPIGSQASEIWPKVFFRATLPESIFLVCEADLSSPNEYVWGYPVDKHKRRGHWEYIKLRDLLTRATKILCSSREEFVLTWL